MTTQVENRYLDYLIHPSFSGVNRLFVLSCANINDKTVYKFFFLPTVKIQNQNARIDGRDFFDQPVKNISRAYESIRKITTGQADYTTACFLDYNYFRDYFKKIAIDLSKEQALDADPKATQQINFAGNLENNASIFFIIEEVEETILDYSQPTSQNYIPRMSLKDVL